MSAVEPVAMTACFSPRCPISSPFPDVHAELLGMHAPGVIGTTGGIIACECPASALSPKAMLTSAEGNNSDVTLCSSIWFSVDDHVASDITVSAILATDFLVDSLVCLKSPWG